MFHNVEFPEEMSDGCTGGPVFLTTIATSTSGYEQRNISRQRAIGQWDVGHLMENDSTRLALLSFFRARKGMGYSFLFKDWQDYFVGMSWVNGVLTHGTPHAIAVGDATASYFQLGIVYSDSAGEDVRYITKPKPNAVKVYLNGAEQTYTTHYTINWTTGVISFVSPPGNGVLVQWTGEFYAHARFKTDAFSSQLHTPHVSEWSSVGIMEVLDRVVEGNGTTAGAPILPS